MTALRADPAAELVCMIRDEPALRYFVNRIHAAHGVALVVVEKPPASGGNAAAKALAALRSGGPGGLARAIHEKRRERAAGAAATRVFDDSFGDRWRRLDPDIEVLETPSINDARVVRRLEAMAPVVALDHGTAIVRDEVLARAAVALNLHWGLSPYYRGTRCTQWALLSWDPLNIGVTVHELTRQVDGGAVVGQARAVVQPSDSALSLNVQLTRLGTEIVVEAVARIRAGVALECAEQDLSRGLVTVGRQWSEHLERHLTRLERNGGVARMISAPARATELPIVTPRR